MAEDFYKILGVRWNASAEQIGQAYRSLVRRYHPDINQESGAYEKFQEIQRAFEVLSDPNKRAEFDRSCKKVAPCSSKGVFNPSKLPITRMPSLIDDKQTLIIVNVICVILMIIVSFVVFFIFWGYDNSANNIASVNEVSPKGAVEMAATWVVIPFLLFILCINICYYATHREYGQKFNWKCNWNFNWKFNWKFNRDFDWEYAFAAICSIVVFTVVMVMAFIVICSITLR